MDQLVDGQKYGGLFNLRFDDTNPVREDDEYVRSIIEDIRWLGAEPDGGIYYGSDYFDKCYEFAVQLIPAGTRMSATRPSSSAVPRHADRAGPAQPVA